MERYGRIVVRGVIIGTMMRLQFSVILGNVMPLYCQIL